MLVKLLKKLFAKLLCMHRWDNFHTMNARYKDDIVEVKQTFICRNCGKIKQIYL